MHPRARTRPRLTPLAALGGAALLSSLTLVAQANEPDATKGSDGVVVIELQTGKVHGANPAITITRPPKDSDGDGYFEGGVQIDLSQYSGLAIEAEYGDVIPRGISLNLGDSRTNNGYRGDSATQSNDAEAHVSDSALFVWGNDKAPREQAQLAKVEGVVEAGCVLRLEARDGFLHYTTTAGQGSGNAIQSAYLYALAGQEDAEGPVNHDLFLGLNCAVNGSRRGTGLARITLRPLR